MRTLLLALIVLMLGAGNFGCAAKSVYRTWGEQLRDMPLHNGRVEDISMLLGCSPIKCEPIENAPPLMGINFDARDGQLIIITVTPNSPAFQAGIRAGDAIRGIGGQHVTTVEQARSAFQNNREGQSVEIETNRGVVSVVPTIPKVEQCYWEVQAGQVARTGGYAFVNRYGGSASSGGSAYERFFRSSCRIHNGFVVGCQSNWQE
jgi:membrane-associated protease RseP (regulator of RpoE activity)